MRDIRRKTRRRFSAEEKIRIVLDGLRGEISVAELCRREGIAANLYYRWSKDFLEAGKKQLSGDTVREATSTEVEDLRAENSELKEVVAEMTLKNRVLKESLRGQGEEDDTRGAVRPRWNPVPEEVRAEVIDLALKKTELCARELACHFTDERVRPFQAPEQADDASAAHAQDRPNGAGHRFALEMALSAVGATGGSLIVTFTLVQSFRML